jgi:4-hydroxy-4-methyl-2-oxoglutarate aldolase
MSILRHPIHFEPIAETAREALRGLETTLLSDALGGRQTSGALRPVKPGLKLVGEARTVFCPGAVRPAVCAIALARPSEVLVIDGGGGEAHASLGGIMARDAEARGLAGCVIDGAVRDVAELRAGALAVFSRAVTPHGAGPDPRGEIDGTVVVAGIRVEPGDVVVGDDDGVVVIPRAELDAVIARAEAKREAEAAWVAAIESGKSLAEVHGFEVPEAAAAPA